MSRKNRSRSVPGMLTAGLLAAVLVTGVAPGVAVAEGDATASFVPACDGGIEGEATDGAGRQVAFRVCPVPGGGFDSVILDRDRRELSRVGILAAGNHVVRVGGVVLEDRDYSVEELARVRRALASPDGPLAGRLPLLLVDAGLEPDALPVLALGAHGPAWERGADGESDGLHPQGGGCTDPATGCLGCCGPGCWGCTGICTPECLAHDECVRDHGHLSLGCLVRLQVAMLSYLECLDCPERCKDGPADCCKGEGPACLTIP